MSAAFGTTPQGQQARLFTLHGDGGIVAKVSDFGATLVELHVPDRDGTTADVVLGFDAVEGYTSDANAYFGATVGRVANRIAGAEFELDGVRYLLASNEPPHHLHGGAERPFSHVMWQLTHLDDGSIELVHVSPAGEEGYPGRVEATVRYRVVGSGLEVRFGAVCDAPTPVNMTNHTYWNLSGAGTGTVLDHQLQVLAERYTPCDDELIPTGGTEPVSGTPLDLRRPQLIGARIDELEHTGAMGYDHNLVIDGEPGRARAAARLRDPDSGRVLELTTDQPGLQLYSGNRLDDVVGKAGRVYERNGGLCLEPQYYPDALHHPEFPSIVLQPGEIYEHVTLFSFGID